MISDPAATRLIIAFPQRYVVGGAVLVIGMLAILERRCDDITGAG